MADWPFSLMISYRDKHTMFFDYGTPPKVCEPSPQPSPLPGRSFPSLLPLERKVPLPFRIGRTCQAALAVVPTWSKSTWLRPKNILSVASRPMIYHGFWATKYAETQSWDGPIAESHASHRPIAGYQVPWRFGGCQHRTSLARASGMSLGCPEGPMINIGDLS